MTSRLVPLVLLAGCATSPPSPFAKGFHPDPPGANQIQVYTPIFKDIQPGQDVTYCTYLDYHTDKILDVTTYKGYQTVGGHHTILYTANIEKPVDIHECTDDDMVNVHYVAGGGADATIMPQSLPDGVVFRVPADKQMMIVSHFINATDAAIDGQSAFDVTVEDPVDTNSPADLFTVVNTQMLVQPGASVVHTDCTVKQPLDLVLVGSHAHEHANHMKVTDTTSAGPQVIQDIPWSPELIFNSPLNKYTKEAPFHMNVGDNLAVDCTYDNPTGSSIAFPAEMCITYGYYFPADREIDCVDGVFPTGS